MEMNREESERNLTEWKKLINNKTVNIAKTFGNALAEAQIIVGNANGLDKSVGKLVAMTHIATQLEVVRGMILAGLDKALENCGVLTTKPQCIEHLNQAFLHSLERCRKEIASNEKAMSSDNAIFRVQYPSNEKGHYS